MEQNVKLIEEIEEDSLGSWLLTPCRAYWKRFRTHANLQIRGLAIEQLSDLPTDEAKSRILQGHKDPDELVRVACLEALAEWRDATFVDAALVKLGDSARPGPKSRSLCIGTHGRSEGYWQS